MLMCSVGKSRSTVRNHQGSGAGGFTLLELVAVLFIVGVAISIAMPTVSNSLRHWRVREATREVATLMKFTRNQSVTGRRTMQVVLDRTRNMFWLDRPAVVMDPEQAEERGIRLYALPTGVRFGSVMFGDREADDAQVGLMFSPQGTTTGGAVQILDEHGRGYQIVLDAVTGRATIRRLDS